MMRGGLGLVLCLCATALVAGCNAEPASHSAGHSASAPATASAPAAETTTSPAAGSSLTTVRIGRYTQEFAGPLPGDPVQASVIDGFREAEVLWNKSDQDWQLVAPVTQFVIGDALSNLRKAISVAKQHGIVFAGTDEFFMTRVTTLSATEATVATCDNGSRLTGVYRNTGQIDSAYVPKPDQAYLLENWVMVRHSGHWAISSFSVISLPDPRAQPCQP